MREQEKAFKGLHAEFMKLKKELFGEDKFVIPDPKNKKWKRYDQLLGFFFPQFRTKGWKDPLKQKAGK
jgi:hypothetical protein